MPLLQADMFSFAVVLWTICTQEVPIRGHLRTLRVSRRLHNLHRIDCSFLAIHS